MRAKKRKGSENYISCIRKTLAAHYGERPIGLGGVFVMENGKARLHVMVCTPQRCFDFTVFVL